MNTIVLYRQNMKKGAYGENHLFNLILTLICICLLPFRLSNLTFQIIMEK